MKIVKLDETFKNQKIEFSYTTTHYYQINVLESKQTFEFRFTLTAFDSPQEKVTQDVFLSDWLENPELYACVEDYEMLGFVELSHETWNNRLRISNIFIPQVWSRRNGIGQQLMAFAMRRATELNARMLILETQSCNYPAISFYQKCGFKLLGFDLAAYANDDIDRENIRLEMGRFI